MKKMISPTRRQLLHALCGMGSLPFLSACGTILYPDRAQQEARGDIDPAIIILDGIGLFFFLVPGIIAFAVDFATGAIYYPADRVPGDKERTIFDDLTRQTSKTDGPLTRQKIERAVSLQTGVKIDLSRSDIRVVELKHLGQFHETRQRLRG